MGKVIDFKSGKVIDKPRYYDGEFEERMKRAKDGLNKINFLMKQLKESMEESK